MIKQHLKLFGKCCKLCEFFGTVQTHWDVSQTKLGLKQHQDAQTKYFYIRVLALAFFILLLITFGLKKLLTVDLQKYDLFENLLFGMTVLLMAWAICCIIACEKNSAASCVYINGLLSLSTLISKPSHIKIPKLGLFQALNLMLAYATYYAIGWMLPFIFVWTLHWQNPCKASIVGYWLIPVCLKEHGVSFILKCLSVPIKMLVLGVNHLVWWYAMSSTAIVVSGFLAMGTQTLHSYLEL